MVEIVLPEEHLSLLRVIGETHIARQTVAIDLDEAAIGTLQRHQSCTTVNDAELGKLTLVASMAVMKQTMTQRNGRTVPVDSPAMRAYVWLWCVCPPLPADETNENTLLATTTEYFTSSTIAGVSRVPATEP